MRAEVDAKISKKIRPAPLPCTGNISRYAEFKDREFSAAASRFELWSKSVGWLLKKYTDKSFPWCEFVLRRCHGVSGSVYKIAPRVDRKKLL